MLSQSELHSYHKLLNTHRQTLRVYLDQQAMHGTLTPPHIVHGIADSREHIHLIKDFLRSKDILVEDRIEDSSQLAMFSSTTEILQYEQIPLQKRLPMLPNGHLYLNRFAIRGFVGRGGFSDAYIAWDRVHDQEIVVKLYATPNQPDYLQRFVEREIKMARVVPKNISGLVKTLEIVPFHGGYCFVQERIPGESLGDRLTAKKVIEVDEALQTIFVLCQILEQLHKIRIAHCDIKPLNIIISSPGKPTIIDLGTARFFDEEIDPMEVVVSPPYSSSALLSGRPIDGRVDIYSLGMTLLHMLTGQNVLFSPNSSMPLEFSIVEHHTSKEIAKYVKERLWEIRIRDIRHLILRALSLTSMLRALSITSRDDGLSVDDQFKDIQHFCSELTKIQNAISQT